MPHALFLGSSLATLDRVATQPDKQIAALEENDENAVIKRKGKQFINMLFRMKKVGGRTKEGEVEGSEPGPSKVPTSEVEGKSDMTYPPQPTQPEATESSEDRVTSHSTHKNNSSQFVRSHLTHAIVDIVMSLLGFAVVINSAYVPAF